MDGHCAAMAAKHPGFRVTCTRNGEYGPVSAKVYATNAEALAAAMRLQKGARYISNFLCVDYHWPFVRAARNAITHVEAD